MSPAGKNLSETISFSATIVAYPNKKNNPNASQSKRMFGLFWVRMFITKLPIACELA